jgi:deoxyribodipyrimidine photo-lyase
MSEARGAAQHCALVWHRNDLRTHDHAALSAAIDSDLPVFGLVVIDPATLGRASVRQRALYLSNTAALRAEYRSLGGILIVRSGPPHEALSELVVQLGAREVHALRSHSPYAAERDGAVEPALLRVGTVVVWHDGMYVHAPGTILTRQALPFSVHTPYARRWWERPVDAPLDPPVRIPSAPLPEAVGAGGIPVTSSDVPLPRPGAAAALQRLDEFAAAKLDDYAFARDRLDGNGTSRLSIDISLGTLSPRVVYHRIHARGGEGSRKFIGELAWRDFMADLVWHRPELCDRPFDTRFKIIEWEGDDAMFRAWREGRTGVPVVDAAMRELRATGWISGRARMVAAQFLTKHMRVDWRLGEQLFRECLLDYDAASNIGNWQWAAGLGVDNAPYFRVFNPVTQGREHDPDGTWLRRWVPESGGDPRPLPGAIIDLGAARREYLAAVAATRGRRSR